MTMNKLKTRNFYYYNIINGIIVTEETLYLINMIYQRPKQ